MPFLTVVPIATVILCLAAAVLRGALLTAVDLAPMRSLLRVIWIDRSVVPFHSEPHHVELLVRSLYVAARIEAVQRAT